MELTVLDIKILKCIYKKTAPVKTAYIENKFGDGYKVSLNILLDGKYIKCPDLISQEQLGFPSEDDWEITDNGRYFLRNYREEKRLTNKQAWIERIKGGIITAITGLAVYYLPKLIDLLSHLQEK